MNHKQIQSQVLIAIMQSPDTSTQDKLEASKQLTALKRTKPIAYKPRKRKQDAVNPMPVSVLGTR